MLGTFGYLCWTHQNAYRAEFSKYYKVMFVYEKGKTTKENGSPVWLTLAQLAVCQTARFSSLWRENVPCVRGNVCTREQACPIKSSPLTHFRRTLPRGNVQTHAQPLGCVLLNLMCRPQTQLNILIFSQGMQGPLPDQAALTWGLCLEFTFSLAWDMSSDVEASCPYLCFRHCSPLGVRLRC